MTALVTDIAVLEKLAERKEEENWEYCVFFKEGSLSSKRSDTVVHRLHAEVAEQIDCTTCANCCKTVLPILDQEDLDNFAQGLGISAEELINKYLTEADTGMTFKSTPCPFLVDNKCSNYEHRPKDCASYPHLHLPGFLRRTLGVMSNCSICPIVFNVIEALKVELPQS